jgi:uncharacterized protein (DUF1697 family)
METYVSMLRGINVSGQKKILMADLKKLYEGLGFKDVVTYIQSGNVIFKSSKLERLKLQEKIKKGILKQFGFDVPVVIRNAEELIDAHGGNPFLKEKGIDQDRIYFTFLESDVAKENLKKVDPEAYLPDRFQVDGSTIYLYCPGGYGETKLSNNFFESKFKVVATTRNLKTVIKLIELATK